MSVSAWPTSLVCEEALIPGWTAESLVRMSDPLLLDQLSRARRWMKPALIIGRAGLNYT